MPSTIVRTSDRNRTGPRTTKAPPGHEGAGGRLDGGGLGLPAVVAPAQDAGAVADRLKERLAVVVEGDRHRAVAPVGPGRVDGASAANLHPTPDLDAGRVDRRERPALEADGEEPLPVRVRHGDRAPVL